MTEAVHPNPTLPDGFEVPDNTGINALQDLDINRAPPNMLLQHASEKTFVLMGMTPTEFKDLCGGTPFDFPTLKRQFTTLCRDYDMPLNANTNSYAVDFCAKILFEVGPDTRKVKKGQSDKTWKFVFTYNVQSHVVGQIATERCYVLVSTYKSSTYEPAFGHNTLVLSVKQASLLAVVTLNRICAIGVDYNFLMTPLAGAIFAREDIPVLAEKFGVNNGAMTGIINSSCQSGGQHLANSNANIAIAAAYSATKGLKDKEQRKQIVTKTTKQYLRTGKAISNAHLAFAFNHAHGGVPNEFSFEHLLTLYKAAQELTFTATNTVPDLETYRGLSAAEKRAFKENALATISH